MNVFTKALAFSVAVTGTAVIGMLTSQLTAREAMPVETLAPAPGMRAAFRQIAPSVVSLEIARKDGQSSQGAAFAIDASGALITAAHVLDQAAEVTAILADGRRLPVRILASDALSDIGVIRIEGANLPPARLAGALPETGEAVAAIGNPLGLRHAASAGIVSGLDRSYGNAPYGFIQHDAALNPGSSGGPLINASGEVVGINIAIADAARHHIGIGLALPVEAARIVAGKLLAQGRIDRPTLGLRLRDGRKLQGVGAGGVVIEAVDPGSAADAAGLKPGMIVSRAAGQPVEAPRDLARALEPLKPGETLELDAGSGGETARYDLRLAAPAPARPSLTRSITVRATVPDPGLVLAPGENRLSRVVPESPAAGAGLKAGDEILAVGTVRVDGASARSVLESAPKHRLPLLIRRGGVSRYVVLGPSGRLDSLAPLGANSESQDSSTL